MMHDEARLREFIRGASRLPVLPKVTVRLLNTLDSAESSSSEIAEIIQAEPTLTARLLKLANSPFYGQRGQISNVRNAVVVLGSKTIRSLALAIWTHTLQSQARNAAEMTLMAPVLSHGLVTGVAARMLAEQSRRQLGEDAFMAGLLHDIGRVALVGQMGAEYQHKILEPAQQEGVLLHEMEIDVLGFDHRALGAALLVSWALPSFIVTVVERHHDSGISPDNDFLLASVALADSLASLQGFNLAPASPRPQQQEIAAHFGLQDQEATTAFLELCTEKVKAISSALESR